MDPQARDQQFEAFSRRRHPEVLLYLGPASGSRARGRGFPRELLELATAEAAARGGRLLRPEPFGLLFSLPGPVEAVACADALLEMAADFADRSVPASAGIARRAPAGPRAAAAERAARIAQERAPAGEMVLSAEVFEELRTLFELGAESLKPTGPLVRGEAEEPCYRLFRLRAEPPAAPAASAGGAAAAATPAPMPAGGYPSALQPAGAQTAPLRRRRTLYPALAVAVAVVALIGGTLSTTGLGPIQRLLASWQLSAASLPSRGKAVSLEIRHAQLALGRGTATLIVDAEIRSSGTTTLSVGGDAFRLLVGGREFEPRPAEAPVSPLHLCPPGLDAEVNAPFPRVEIAAGGSARVRLVFPEALRGEDLRPAQPQAAQSGLVDQLYLRLEAAGETLATPIGSSAAAVLAEPREAPREGVAVLELKGPVTCLNVSGVLAGVRERYAAGQGCVVSLPADGGQDELAVPWLIAATREMGARVAFVDPAFVSLERLELADQRRVFSTEASAVLGVEPGPATGSRVDGPDRSSDGEVLSAEASAPAAAGDETENALIRTLERPLSSQRYSAVQQLARLPNARDREPVVAALVRAAADTDPAVREAAFEALLRLRREREAKDAALVELSRPQPELSAVRIARANRDSRAVEPLIVLLPQKGYGRAAAAALGELGGPRARQALLRELERGDETNHEVPRALGRLGNARDVDALIRAYEATQLWPLRKAVIVDALSKLRGEKALQQSLRALGDPSAEVRRSAISAVVRFDDRRALPALQPLLADTAVGPAAGRALARIGGSEARPILEQAAQSSEETIRASAAEGLKLLSR
ncbi:MAG: HEAT repeat domain-containing protein [Armatimonadota bacterium]